ncbi:hypothetical protein [Leptolyngbya sp. FACHB-261]|uniref:hypothetical protein n=1 Tax=Leptolyngbya sp. FACHB-261 TaxID=2692806 RepID=UPI001689BA3A|nr:hypothetical protein [Leptolyngbya sp. FACHB-261]MBD2100823.1 hypothetical protein [Leptolyngbya sp. FACHB-261]
MKAAGWRFGERKRKRSGKDRSHHNSSANQRRIQKATQALRRQLKDGSDSPGSSHPNPTRPSSPTQPVGVLFGSLS